MKLETIQIMNYNAHAFSSQMDIGYESTLILKTILLLDRPYAGSYITRILQGNTDYPLKKAIHKNLETYGELEDVYFAQIENIITYLLKEGYLMVVNAIYGNISITEKGTAYLSDPCKIRVERKQLVKSWFEIELIRALKRLRKEMAKQEEVPPFRLFTNYTLHRLVSTMPTHEDMLEEIEGIREASPQLKQLVISEIQRVITRKERDEILGGMYSRAYSSSHRKVKELYESGFNPKEIAQRRRLSERKATDFLETLHRVGEIDLKPWIEETVDSQDLHKGIEYFKQVKTPKLREARAVLGMDYRTLQLCRIYASKVETSIPVYST